MDVRKELIIGIMGSLILVGIVFVNIGKFNSIKQKTIKNKPNTALLERNIISSGPSSPSLILTEAEVAKHKISSDCWIIINNGVYDATNYLILHPGGANRIIPYCGSDASQAFISKGGSGSHSQTAYSELTALKLGDLNQSVSIQNSLKNVVNSVNQINNSQRRQGEEEYEDD